MAGVQVPISYPVNTVGLTESINLLKQSKTASDQLITSTKRLGTETAAAGRQVSSTLEGMNLRLQQLRGQINNTSQANTAQLQKLSAEYKALQAEIDKTNRKLFEQQKAAKSTGDEWQTMVNTVRAFIAYQIGKEIINISLSLATMRGNLEGVTNAFNKLPNATLLLQNLRRATHGTVDDLNLMQQALRAQNYRIPLQHMGTLLEFAATKAQQTGQEVQHLIDYLVSGIGLRSIKRLDDLGFTANRVKEALGGVSLQAASMGELMTAVTTLMNEDLQKTGGYLKTSKTLVEQLTTNITALQQTVAKKLDSSGIVSFMADAVKAIDFFIRAGGDPALFKVFLLQEQAMEQASASVDKFVKSKESQLKTEDEVKKAVDDEIKATQELIKQRQELIDKSSKYEFTVDASGKVVKTETEAIQQSVMVLQAKIELLKKYIPVRREAAAIDEEAAEEERKRFNEELIDRIARSMAAITDQNIANFNSLMKWAEGYGKLKNEAIPTLDGIEEDTKETTEEILTAWEEFFARFRIGWSQSSKHFRSEQEQMNAVIGEIKQASFELTESLLMAEINAEVDAFGVRISNARDYYDNLIQLAGNNEKRKVELQIQRDRELERLERKKGEAETRAAKRQVYINGAMAVARAFADYEYPYSLIVAALAGAATLAQIGEISKAPKGYAKGVIGLKGKGTETSDSIPARLSVGESVMTAEETRNNFKTLHKIRAGKLNDKVLDKILAGNVTVIGSDDRRTADKIEELIKITKANRPPDYVEKAGLLYRVVDKGKNSKRYIRSKYGF